MHNITPVGGANSLLFRNSILAGQWREWPASFGDRRWPMKPPPAAELRRAEHLRPACCLKLGNDHCSGTTSSYVENDELGRHKRDNICVEMTRSRCKHVSWSLRDGMEGSAGSLHAN